jgi:hypothetical protein
VAEAEQDTAGMLPKLSLAASKKGMPRKRSKNKPDVTAKKMAVSSPKAIRNKQSNLSIVDLDQVEARHGLEIYHRRTLSESWDELFRSMAGFSDGSAHHDGAQSQSHRVEMTKPAWPAGSTLPGKYSPNEFQNVPPTLPPVPGPRSSSITATVNASLTRQSFQVLVAELPADSSPTRRPKPKSTNQEDWTTEADMNCLQREESHKTHLQGVRSSGCLSMFGPAPNPTRSAIALEGIESEMDNDRSTIASTPTRVTQAFSINRTPPQPLGPPTNPPNGPLPELPEEFDRADAAPRASSHRSSPIRQSRPMVPLRSRHRPNPTANSTSANLTLPAMYSPKAHHGKHSSIGIKSPKKAASISSTQSAPVGGTSSQTHAQRGKALSVGNKTNTASFNRVELGSSPEFASPTASEIDLQAKDMVDSPRSAVTKSALPSNDVLSSRSEHTRALKLRDLAKERSFRVVSRPRRSGLNDTIGNQKASFVDEEGTATTTTILSHFPPVPGMPFDSSHDRTSVDSTTSSYQESVEGRPSFQARCSPCNRTVRPIMYQSQIMVLAETDPDTQMFRASTPTVSVRRINSNAAESGIMTKERKVRKQNSKNPAHSHTHSAAGPKGMVGKQLNGEHTPPLSDLSSHTSDDDMGGTPPTRSSRNVHHVSTIAKEDSDIEPSTPSKRAFAALARREQKNYFKEQLLLKKLKREGCELQLAMRLLSRGLEKLTTFVETDEEFGESGGHGLRGGEMVPVKGMAKRLGQLLSPEGWEGFDQDFGHEDHQEDDADAGARAKHERDVVGSARMKSAFSNDARPIRLVSRFSSVRRGGSVIGGLPIRDDVIWDQVEVLNKAAIRVDGVAGM